MRLLIHFARFGPYHHARIRAAYQFLAPQGWEVIGLETAGTDATYAWDQAQGSDDGPRVVTAFPGKVFEQVTAAEYRATLLPLLDSLKPDAMAIAGWGSPDALMCLSWCRKSKVPCIVMSETRAADGQRIWWKELPKRYLISNFDAALVGGRLHRDYLTSLGMKPDRIALGYDVVDSCYFRHAVKTTRENLTEREKARPYFLASNRFIQRKNLLRLLEAYSAYLREKQKGVDHADAIKKPTTDHRRNDGPAWALVLLGDGEEKPAILARCHELGLRVSESTPWECSTDAEVFFPGFRQIKELPDFYANAGAFIHPALEEPWGLVVNEAMASGLPVMVSDRCGCTPELVRHGVNGYTFDPYDVESLASLMVNMSNMPEEQRAEMGIASQRIIADWGPERFASGLKAAVDKALEVGPIRPTLLQRAVLATLIRR